MRDAAGQLAQRLELFRLLAAFPRALFARCSRITWITNKASISVSALMATAAPTAVRRHHSAALLLRETAITRGVPSITR